MVAAQATRAEAAGIPAAATDVAVTVAEAGGIERPISNK